MENTQVLYILISFNHHFCFNIGQNISIIKVVNNNCGCGSVGSEQAYIRPICSDGIHLLIQWSK